MDKCTQLVILASFPLYETKMPDCGLAAIKWTKHFLSEAKWFLTITSWSNRECKTCQILTQHSKFALKCNNSRLRIKIKANY